MVGFSILVGTTITGGLSFFKNPLNLVLAFMTGFTLTGASMAINDYFDKDIDSINEPMRPIPSGVITLQEAVIIFAGLSIVGLTSPLYINTQAFFIAVIAWALLIIYSAWGKKTGFLGNLMVSSCVSMPFVFSGVLTKNVNYAFTFSLLAFLSNTGREITKGIVDIKGDKASGVRTIAATQGARAAAIIASIFYICAVISSIIPVYLEQVSKWYIPFITITDLGLLWGTINILKDPSSKMSRRVKNYVLYFMLSGLLGFSAGSLF
jgi:geranylgeranylglycerol-phosphate geranylgeranyltransferase